MVLQWGASKESSLPQSLVSETADIAALKPKNPLGDQGDLPPIGDTDLADLFLSVAAGDVFRRFSCGRGMAGAARGVRYLSAGFMVWICPDMALSEALRSRKGLTCMGTFRILTDWPGRYGHAVVEGREVLCISVPSLSSYCDCWPMLGSLELGYLHNTNNHAPFSSLHCVWDSAHHLRRM